MFSLCAFVAHGEEGYFTWVDAQGRVHNSPVSSHNNDAPPQAEDSAKEHEAASDAQPPNDIADFESEASWQQKQADAASPKFFVWTDAQGITRTEPIVQKSSESTSGVVHQVTSDATFIPPLRVKPSASCCAAWRSLSFEGLDDGDERVNRELSSAPMIRFDGRTYRAWPTMRSGDALNIPLLHVLSVYGERLGVTVFALDRTFSLLHVAPMKGREKAANWLRERATEFVITLDDPAVKYLVFAWPINTPQGVSASLEAKYHER